MAQLKVTLKRSVTHRIPEQRRVVKALGLGKINSSAVHPDNAAVRGAIVKIAHLVEVEAIED